MSTRGIFVVAFGEPARRCAVRLLKSAKRHMPDVPIALCSSATLGLEDVLIREPDADVGGRRAKLKAYDLTPQEWQSVLYLDADTEIVAPVYRLFEWCEDGWEFVICRDVGETLHSFQRKNNLRELAQMRDLFGTLHALQYNGGVWAFRRCPAAQMVMAEWRREYEVHLQRDQGALIRALHRFPLRLLVLGNEWNTCTRPNGVGFSPGVTTAGVMHYPEQARRWRGKIPGRIDAPEAWAIVKRQGFDK